MEGDPLACKGVTAAAPYASLGLWCVLCCWCGGVELPCSWVSTIVAHENECVTKLSVCISWYIAGVRAPLLHCRVHAGVPPVQQMAKIPFGAPAGLLWLGFFSRSRCPGWHVIASWQLEPLQQGCAAVGLQLAARCCSLQPTQCCACAIWVVRPVCVGDEALVGSVVTRVTLAVVYVTFRQGHSPNRLRNHGPARWHLPVCCM